MAIYPAKNDWENIKTLTGDESWGADNMRNYWKKIEKNEAPFPSDISAHGYSGWLKTALTPIVLIAQDFKLLSVVLGGAEASGMKVGGLLTIVNKLQGGLLGGLLNKVRAGSCMAVSTEDCRLTSKPDPAS